MRISKHAIERYRERIESVTEEQARVLLIEIAERGHEPAGSEWAKFSVAKESGKSYRIYGKALVIVDVKADVVLTVLRARRNAFQRVPRERGYRRERINYQEGE